jgi:hypothetical protein
MEEPNYTNSENAGQGQDPQDLINASLIFGRTLGLIFEEGEGIVVDVKGDIKLAEDVKKIIVFKYKNQVHIYKCDEDLEEGTTVNMDASEGNSELTDNN